MNNPSSILIVDDEPNVRLMFRTTLSCDAFRLLEADTGMAALAELETRSVDLILLDLHMPVLDGMSTLRSLRERGDKTPVVIVTAHGSVPDAVAAMKLGAIDFLQKPVTPTVLRQVVKEVLGRHESTKETPETGELIDNSAPVTISGQFSASLVKAKRALNKSHFEEANVYLTLATALEPSNAEANNLLGVLYELKGQNDDAYRAYRTALKTNKHYAPAMHNMTRYYERFTFGHSSVPVDIGDT